MFDLIEGDILDVLDIIFWIFSTALWGMRSIDSLVGRATREFVVKLLGLGEENRGIVDELDF